MLSECSCSIAVSSQRDVGVPARESGVTVMSMSRRPSRLAGNDVARSTSVYEYQDKCERRCAKNYINVIPGIGESVRGTGSAKGE